MMQWEPEEKALVESYLRVSPAPGRMWLVVLVCGLLVCAGAVVIMLFGAPGSLTGALLGLVAGLVVIARALDDRKRTIMARVIQKYDRAVSDTDAGAPAAE